MILIQYFKKDVKVGLKKNNIFLVFSSKQLSLSKKMKNCMSNINCDEKKTFSNPKKAVIFQMLLFSVGTSNVALGLSNQFVKSSAARTAAN